MTSAHKERTIRTHIVLPEKLVKEIDQRVGPRKRSEYIAGLVEQHLRRTTLGELTKALAGRVSAEDAPHWDTPEASHEWLRASRESRDPWEE